MFASAVGLQDWNLSKPELWVGYTYIWRAIREFLKDQKDLA